MEQKTYKILSILYLLLGVGAFFFFQESKLRFFVGISFLDLSALHFLLYLKPQKENLLLRESIACALGLQLVLFLMCIGERRRKAFVFDYKAILVLIYWLGINIVTFFTFMVDKKRAGKHKNRIQNTTLLRLSFLGGAVGGMLAMRVFRHKTKKNYYTIGLPMMFALQILCFAYLYFWNH